MTDSFSDRMREALIAPDAVDLDALRAAVKPSAARSRLTYLLDAVRLAFGLRLAPERDAAARKALNGRASQQVIGPSAQEQLLALLALNSLIESFAQRAAAPAPLVTASLAIRTLAAVGEIPRHPDLLHHANDFLTRQASLVRSSDFRLPAPMGEAADPEIPPALAGAEIAPISQNIQAVGTNLLQQAHRIDELAGIVDGLKQREEHRHQVSREERGFLWWLLGEPHAAPHGQLVVHTATVMAEITRFLTPPVGSEQLVKHRLGSEWATVLTAESATEAAEAAASYTGALPDELKDLCPLLNDPTGFEALEPTVGFATRALYDEILLTRAYRKASGDR